MSSDQRKGGDLDALLEPFVEVDLGEKFGKAFVYSFGARHLSRYAKEVASAISLIASTEVTAGEGVDVKLQYFSVIGPHVMCNMLPLIGECVRLDPKRDFYSLPHYVLPKIIQAWMEHNLGTEEKRDPWRAVVERTVKALTGKNVKISEMFSRISSSPATGSETSSTADGQAGHTPGGATGS